MAAYDYPYFKLRLTSMGVEAEILRRAKTRAVGGCSLGGPAVREGGVAGFPCTRECPQPPTRAGIRI